jgi:hypothetical protein
MIIMIKTFEHRRRQRLGSRGITIVERRVCYYVGNGNGIGNGNLNNTTAVEQITGIEVEFINSRMTAILSAGPDNRS